MFDDQGNLDSDMTQPEGAPLWLGVTIIVAVLFAAGAALASLGVLANHIV